MEELIKQVFATGTKDIQSNFTIAQAFVALFLSFFLCLFIGVIYRLTHKGISYSKTYVQTLVILGVTVSIIMLIIGSNIARAFSLVGALSIIRFRNAMKETRDVAFIFLAMAVGMACGTRFYLLAIIFTVVVTAMIYFMNILNVGAIPISEKILKVFLPENMEPEEALKDIFYQYVQEHALLSIQTVRQGLWSEAVYSIRFKRGINQVEFMNKIRQINGNAKVAIIEGMNNVDI